MASSSARAAVLAAPLFSAAVLAMATPEIQQWEGRRLYPYYDIVQKLTVCDGETHGIQMRFYTHAECDAMTGRALRRTADGIRPCLPSMLTVQIQVAILVTAYNIGVAAFCGSTIARRLRAGDFVGACNAIPLWNKGRIKGRLVAIQGLTNRRAAERNLCMAGTLR